MWSSAVALAAIGALEDRYDERILQRVDFTLRRYDENKDGILDEREIGRARWSGGSPAEHDLNKDGKLTRAELAERYVAREESDQGRGRERGGDNGQGGQEDWRSRWANASPEERAKMQEEMRARFGGGRGGPGGGDPRGGTPDENGARERSDDSGDSRQKEEPARDRRSSRDERRSSRGGGESKTSAAELEERYTKYVDSIFRSKDGNEDGKLDEKEQESLGSAIKVEEADGDGDGILTKKEVLESLLKRAQKSSSSSSSSSSKSESSSRSKQRTVYQRVSIKGKLEDMGLKSDFIDEDKNGDGQLQMSEFASRWTQKKLEEFQKIDTNGDGVISPKEWLGN